MNENANVTVRLLKRIKEGDGRALDELFCRYFDRLHAVVRLRMGPMLRAKLESIDIVQEACLASLRGLNDFAYTSEGCFFHWLCKTAENRIRDLAEHFAALKRDMRREQPLEVLSPSADSVFGPINELAISSSPASKVIRAEELERLESAMDLLPGDQREALLLVRYEQLSLGEAGAMMNRSPDAVRMLIARAIVALGKTLGTTDNR